MDRRHIGDQLQKLDKLLLTQGKRITDMFVPLFLKMRRFWRQASWDFGLVVRG
jgi:hypothetical protein